MTVLKFPTYTPKELLEERLTDSETMKTCVLLELHVGPEKPRFMAVSDGTLEDVCLLKCMLDSWLVEQFQLCQHVEHKR